MGSAPTYFYQHRIKMIWSSVGLFLAVALVNTQGLSIQGEEAVSIHGDEVEQELDVLEGMLGMGAGARVKRDDRGITNYDIREALIQMLKAMRAQDKKEAQAAQAQDRKLDDIDGKVNAVGKSVEKKIDMISTYLIRMNNKIEALAKGGGGGSRRSTAILETLAQESYDIISLLPTYIDNTRKAIYFVGNDTKSMIDGLGNLLTDEYETGSRRNLREALDATESHILSASRELKDMVVESGSMARASLRGWTMVTRSWRMRSRVLPMWSRFSLTPLTLWWTPRGRLSLECSRSSSR